MLEIRAFFGLYGLIQAQPIDENHRGDGTNDEPDDEGSQHFHGPMVGGQG